MINPNIQWIKFVSSQPANTPNKWVATVQLPSARYPEKFLIFKIGGSYRAVSAYCPHQGYDLSEVDLDEALCLNCPLHQRTICLEGEGSSSYAVKEVDSEFWLGLHPTLTQAQGTS